MKYKSISDGIKTGIHDDDTVFVVQRFGIDFAKYVLHQPKNFNKAFFDIHKDKVTQLDNRVMKGVKYVS